MEQKKIEHITLNLIVFGTIVIIGVLARQTVLHYGWDEFSSNLILVVCSIIMGAIYLNLQMVFGQLLSPTIEKCFMRFPVLTLAVRTSTRISVFVQSPFFCLTVMSKSEKYPLTKENPACFTSKPIRVCSGSSVHMTVCALILAAVINNRNNKIFFINWIFQEGGCYSFIQRITSVFILL